MPYKVLKNNIVDDEIEKAIEYYDSISLKLGIRFEREIENALDRLEENPLGYFNLEDNRHRRIKINGFPYAFAYLLEGDNIIVKILYSQQGDPAQLKNL